MAAQAGFRAAVDTGTGQPRDQCQRDRISAAEIGIINTTGTAFASESL